MKYLLLLFSLPFYGQVLHHQMISSQGQSTRTSNGVIINQTIGQQSLTGTATKTNTIVLQGFQQSQWGKYINSSSDTGKVTIQTNTYPNPFTKTIQFQFSKVISEPISVLIYDILGRTVYEQTSKSITTILTLDLASLPTAEYLVRLNTSELHYTTKIIKQ